MVDDDNVVSGTVAHLAMSASVQTLTLQEVENDRLRRQSWLLKAKFQVDRFMEKHGFRMGSDVNVPKKTAFGLRRTYPLLMAACDQDWHMVCLLLYFGANPLQRDSSGRTMFSSWKGTKSLSRFASSSDSLRVHFLTSLDFDTHWTVFLRDETLLIFSRIRASTKIGSLSINTVCSRQFRGDSM